MAERFRRLSEFQVDVIGAGVLLLIGEAEALLTVSSAQRSVAAVSIAIQAIALAWRRRYPLVVVVIVASTAGLAALLGLPSNGLISSLVTILVAMYSAGAQRSIAPAAVGLVVGVLFVQVAILASGKGTSDLAFGLLVVGVPWAIGRAMHGRGQQISRLELEREERARMAVVEERSRIARELHDVVAHSMGVMVVQAQAAERMLSVDEERAREAVRQIQTTGRDALEEMHRLVAILRESDDHTLRPQGSLRQLDALVDQMRSTGLQVAVKSEGDLNHLPAGIDLAAYRIVQESLTNSLKHGGRSATVTVERSNRELSIRVDDAGGGERGNRAGDRHGLVGMRERVRLYGGSFDAGPRREGGFSVRATLHLR